MPDRHLTEIEKTALADAPMHRDRQFVEWPRRAPSLSSQRWIQIQNKARSTFESVSKCPQSTSKSSPFSRPRFYAHVGAWGVGLRAHTMQVRFQNAQTTEAKRRSRCAITVARTSRILLKELGDGGLEGIQLARALTGSGGLRRRHEIFDDGSMVLRPMCR